MEHATTILTDIPFEWNNPISFDTEGRTEGKVCGVRLGWLPEGMGTGGTATAYDSVTAQDPAQAELLTQEERDLVEYTYNFYTVRGEQKEYSIQCMSADEVAGCDFLCGGSRTEITKQGTIGPYDASWVETHWKNSNQDAGEPEEQSMQLLLLYDREFGGKLFDDYHASRVLPGFQPDSKLQMLLQLKDQAEIVVVISADWDDAERIAEHLEIVETSVDAPQPDLTNGRGFRWIGGVG